MQLAMADRRLSFNPFAVSILKNRFSANISLTSMPFTATWQGTHSLYARFVPPTHPSGGIRQHTKQHSGTKAKVSNEMWKQFLEVKNEREPVRLGDAAGTPPDQMGSKTSTCRI